MGNERIRNIKEVADGMENVNYRYFLTDEQIKDSSELYIEMSSEIAKLEDEYAEIKRDYNRRLKALKEKAGKVLGALEEGFRDIQGDCFYIDDYAANMRRYYDETGLFVRERPLKFSERGMASQVRLHHETNKPEYE